MPSLQGFEVQTHPLPDGREIDVLGRPGQPRLIWVPGIQVAELSGSGLRAGGRYSTSDAGQAIDPSYKMRVPDPHKLYSRTRVRSTTLFAVEGLIQKAFHTGTAGYVAFCCEFIIHVLPAYEDFAAHHAELIMALSETLDHFDATGRVMPEYSFRAACASRDSRLDISPGGRPVLVLGTLAGDRVLSNWAKPSLDATPVADMATVQLYPVARLHAAYEHTERHRERHPGDPPLAVHLAMAWPDGAITLSGGGQVAKARPAATPEPPPEAIDQPLPGLPTLFEDRPCPIYGAYESPEWVGPYVCDVLGLANSRQALSRVPPEEKGVRVVDTPGGAQSMTMLKEPGLYRLIATSHKPEAERFKNWLFRDVLPAIRRYGYYAMPGARPGPTADEVRAALRAILLEELPTVITPVIQQTIWAQANTAQFAELAGPLVDAAARMAEANIIHEKQLGLMQQTVDLIMPGKQLFLSAQDYVEADGVAEALRRAPKLAVPVFEMDHCPDYGKASLFMKRLCRAERKKVALNAVERMIAEENGLEVPPLYITPYQMRRIERDNNKVLMFTPPCWARCKQTFLPTGTPTLLFPGPKAERPTTDGPKAEEA